MFSCFIAILCSFCTCDTSHTEYCHGLSIEAQSAEDRNEITRVPDESPVATIICQPARSDSKSAIRLKRVEPSSVNGRVWPVVACANGAERRTRSPLSRRANQICDRSAEHFEHDLRLLFCSWQL